jgi:mono/diheme cytochrome c family protein
MKYAAAIFLFMTIAGAAHADSSVDIGKAKSSFAEKLFPYMRKNCAECHSESAVYPHGPDHSHGNVDVAFSKFYPFVNWDNPESSRLMKMVTSRHFCTDYQYNCQKADQIVADYSKLLRDYISGVKQASLVTMPPKGSPASFNVDGSDMDFSVHEPSVRIDGKRLYKDSLFFEFDASAIRSAANRRKGDLKAEIRLEPFGEGFVRVSQLGLIASDGVYLVRGISILVNGQTVARQTDLSRVNRFIDFDVFRRSRSPVERQNLLNSMPIFKFSEGDKIQLGFYTLAEVERYPSRICSESAVNDQDIRSLVNMWMVSSRSPSVPAMKKREVCRLVESQIDFAHPRRSVLLSQLSPSMIRAATESIERLAARYPAVGAEVGVLDDLSNGRKLFRAAGCANCHTGSAPESPALGGGLALPTPFGTFYTPNISSDPKHGIGKWSDADFIGAMRTGKRPSDGAPYYPVFPYRSYAKMTDEDLLSIKKYIMSLPPAETASRDHELKFLYRLRSSVWAWQKLYFQAPTGNPEVDIKVAAGEFSPDRAKSEEWNRGAYLVEAVAHCTECHTPRTYMGGLDVSRWMGGDPQSPLGRPVPNITTSAKGRGHWSASDWAKFLETGVSREGKVATGEMGEVIEGLDRLSARDKAAMATYLFSLPAVND